MSHNRESTNFSSLHPFLCGCVCVDRESGVLQSMGSQRVEHNWATELNWLWLHLHSLEEKKKKKTKNNGHILNGEADSIWTR